MPNHSNTFSGIFAHFTWITILKNIFRWLLQHIIFFFCSCYFAGVYEAKRDKLTWIYLPVNSEIIWLVKAVIDWLPVQLIYRSSRSQMFFKIAVHKNFSIFTGKHQCWSLQHRLFLVDIAKFLRTAIFIEHLRTTAFQYTVSHWYYFCRVFFLACSSFNFQKNLLAKATFKWNFLINFGILKCNNNHSIWKPLCLSS